MVPRSSSSSSSSSRLIRTGQGGCQPRFQAYVETPFKNCSPRFGDKTLKFQVIRPEMSRKRDCGPTRIKSDRAFRTDGRVLVL